MEEKTPQDFLTEYLDLLRRGKYLILLPLVISVFLGSAVAFKLPKVYRAEAKMFYMQAQVPDWAKLEVINMYLEAMLVYIQAYALSPIKVQGLIDELELYPELNGRVASSDIIAHFKEQFILEYDYQEVPSKYGRSEEVVTGFTFSFDHADGRKAYYVANALATSFMEIFRQFREASSARSETFFESERERLRREIAVVDQQIANFKQKHVNELPELFALNYRMVDGIANKLFNLDQKYMLLRSQKRTYEAQLSTLSPVLGMTGISGDRIVTPQERLLAMEAELGQLRARYSDRHPDVRRVQNEIVELTVLIAAEDLPSDKNGEHVLGDKKAAFNPVYSRLLIQLEEIKADMVVLKVEQEEYEGELKEYQRRVGMTPLVEKEWLILERDRSSAQTRFNDLSGQVQTMVSAAEMEKRELGGRLSIGQPPIIPLKPYKPNIPMVIGISTFVGLLVGVGLLLGWDFLFKTVRTSQDLMAGNKLTVLVELPMVLPDGEAWRPKVNVAYVRVGVLVLLIIVVVAVDMFFMKVDVLAINILVLIQTKLALLGL